MLASPAPIADLVMMALETEAVDDEGAEEGAQEGAQGASDAERRAVAAAVADMLAEKAPMLREYFAVDIDEETKALTGLPALVEGHTPPTSRLPEFVLSLAHEVEWEEEKGCFRSCRATLWLGFTRRRTSTGTKPGTSTPTRVPIRVPMRCRSGCRESGRGRSRGRRRGDGGDGRRRGGGRGTGREARAVSGDESVRPSKSSRRRAR